MNLRMSTQKKKQYDETNITVLRGLQPIQKRPGMYTNTENPNHIFHEVIDNAQDEALAGYAKNIHVEIYEDGAVSVEDDGRGIPVGMHPEEKRPAVEVIFSVLHSGGKFDREGGGYGFTGGLHGVGVSVTNALTDRLEVTVWRDGYEHTLAFEKGALVEPLKKKKLPADQAKKTGTRVKGWPSGKYFDNPQVSATEMERFLRTKSPLLSGSSITWQRPGKPLQQWTFPGGLTQYLDEQTGSGAWPGGEEFPSEEYWLENGWIAPPFVGKFFHETDNDQFKAGEGFELVCGWREENSVRESYVNLIPTREGGRHETGLRAGLLEALRKAGDRSGAVPKGVKIESDDIMSGLSFIMSVKLRDPHFHAQTKDRLTSKEAHTLVQGMAQDAMELWLNDHPVYAKALLDHVVQAAIRRSKASVKTERKRTFGATVLPGKLTDCLEKDVSRTELFIVEGDSAGGSGKQGRNKDNQAILPIRGKILNTWEVESHKAMESDTVNDISTAIGVDPHPGKVDGVDLTRLRYGKIFIMADADVDGSHIQTLLLTLFFKHFPMLVQNGHIWVARAPLYRVDVPAKKGEKTPRKMYALNDDELDDIRKKMRKEGLADEKIVVSRFKGLGEMNPEQLWETTMNPDSRRPVQIKMPPLEVANEAFELMMAKKTAGQRKEWMEREGHLAKADI